MRTDRVVHRIERVAPMGMFETVGRSAAVGIRKFSRRRWVPLTAQGGSLLRAQSSTLVAMPLCGTPRP